MAHELDENDKADFSPDAFSDEAYGQVCDELAYLMLDRSRMRPATSLVSPTSEIPAHEAMRQLRTGYNARCRRYPNAVHDIACRGCVEKRGGYVQSFDWQERSNTDTARSI